MKKILTSIVALLAWAGTSMAQSNAFSVADIELPQNGEAELVINFQFDAPDTYTAYSFSISVPSDLSFEMDTETGETDVAYTQGDAYHKSHGITANLSEGLVKVACLSTGSVPMTKQSGELVTFTIKAGDLTVGQTYTGTIKDILITPVLGEKKSLADVSFTIKIIENDGRIKFDENATKLPKYTAGESANVKMTRTINADEWSTIVLPFTLTKAKAEAAFGADVKLAEFTGFDTEYSDDDDVTPDAIKLKFATYTMTSKKGMTAGKPFMIKTSKKIESFEADGVTLGNSVSEVSVEDEFYTPGKFTGSLVGATIPADGLFISGNTFYYSKGATVAKAFRCWFELGAVLDKETNFASRVTMVFDDATGIQNVNVQNEGEAIYNLNGLRVKTPAKGLYIKNGKKVIIK